MKITDLISKCKTFKPPLTREQQISDAAQMNDLCGNRHDLDCFAAGAQWADSHPYWHKYPEDPPPVEDRHYFVNYLITASGMYTVARYTGGKFCDLYGFEDVFDPLKDQDIIVAWKELPEPPKFD